MKKKEKFFDRESMAKKQTLWYFNSLCHNSCMEKQLIRKWFVKIWGEWIYDFSIPTFFRVLFSWILRWKFNYKSFFRWTIRFFSWRASEKGRKEFIDSDRKSNIHFDQEQVFLVRSHWFSVGYLSTKTSKRDIRVHWWTFFRQFGHYLCFQESGSVWFYFIPFFIFSSS